jgi:predicted RNase H-like nuclease (RuvC/YqgF family)
MIPIPSKLIAYGLLLAGLTGGFFWVKNAFDERAEYKQKSEELTRSLDAAIAGASLYQENNERQVKLISEFQGKLDEKQAINSQLERDVAANRKRMSIKGASCPASTTTANTSTTETAPQYSAEFRQSLFGIRSGIIKIEENYALCLKILDEDRRMKKSPQ